MGMGQQEEFYGCSDIAIESTTSSQNNSPVISSTPTTITASTKSPTTITTTTAEVVSADTPKLEEPVPGMNPRVSET